MALLWIYVQISRTMSFSALCTRMQSDPVTENLCHIFPFMEREMTNKSPKYFQFFTVHIVNIHNNHQHMHTFSYDTIKL